LSAKVPANVVFMTIVLGTEIQSPRAEEMTVLLKLDHLGLRLNFEPYLFVDGVLNGKLYELFLDFNTGQIDVRAKGLLGQLKATVERELRKLLSGTWLDQEVRSELFPYHPFEDPDLKGTLSTLQQQLKAKFKPKAGEDTRPPQKKEATPLPPLESLELSLELRFKEQWVHDFGVGKAIVAVGNGLRLSVQLKGNLNQLETLTIPYIALTSEGVQLSLQEKLDLLIQKITFRYGGQLHLDEVHFDSARNERLKNAVEVVVEELLLPLFNEKVKGSLTELLEDKIDPMLAGRGLSAKTALGL
jgi:hypothetical protein